MYKLLKNMNGYDKNNLKFIMNATSDQLDEWIKSVDEDDISYAFELINRASAELETEALNMMDDVKDLTDANQVIKMIIEKSK
jgi:hypothetical protein